MKLTASEQLNTATYNALSEISKVTKRLRNAKKAAIEVNESQELLATLQYNIDVLLDLEEQLEEAWQKVIAENGYIMNTYSKFSGNQCLYFSKKNSDTTVVFDMPYQLNLMKVKKNGYTYWEIDFPKEYYLPLYRSGKNEYLIDGNIPKTIMSYGAPILNKPTILVAYTPEEGKTELIFSNSFYWLNALNKNYLPDNTKYLAWSYKLEISTKDNTVKAEIDLFRSVTPNNYTFWIAEYYNNSNSELGFDELTKAIDKCVKAAAKK